MLLNCNNYLLLQEERALKNQTFGPLTPITRDQYREIYTNTGIDIDGRSDLATKVYLPRFKPIIHGMVAFAKVLPGFKELPLEDQTALLKGKINHSNAHVQSNENAILEWMDYLLVFRRKILCDVKPKPVSRKF